MTRTLSTRILEITDGKYAKSAIKDQTSTTGHCYTMDGSNILVLEDKWFPRKIGEALHIHKRSPAFD